MRMYKLTYLLMVFGMSSFVLGKLVIDVVDLDTVDASLIEREATLLEKTVREGNCEGAKVRTTILLSG